MKCDAGNMQHSVESPPDATRYASEAWVSTCFTRFEAAYAELQLIQETQAAKLNGGVIQQAAKLEADSAKMQHLY